MGKYWNPSAPEMPVKKPVEEPQSVVEPRLMEPCKTCGKDVSTEAKMCPHCGSPSDAQREKNKAIDRVKKTFGLGCLLIVAGVAVTFLTLMVVMGLLMAS